MRVCSLEFTVASLSIALTWNTYPTTYVVDRNGNIVGDPIVGAITETKQAEALQAQIDKALSADKG